MTRTSTAVREVRFSWDQAMVPPQALYRHFLVLLPIAASLILQRLFHVVDNRYLSQIHSDALLLHNVQYNFVVFGQFLGLATATSALVFWRRPEIHGARTSLLLRHLALNTSVVLLFGATAALCLDSVLSHFGIRADLLPTARLYTCLGLINMVLQSTYTALDGFLIASGRQKTALIFATLQLIANICADHTAVRLYQQTHDMLAALLVVGGSSSLILIVSVTIAVALVHRAVRNEHHKLAWSELTPVWRAELGIYLIRGTAPLVLMWQFAEVHASFLVTNNLATHIAYLACLPLAAGCQVAVRDASAERGGFPWWVLLGYTALLPTALLLVVCGLLGPELLSRLYLYAVPSEQIIYLPLFFLACLIGQVGNLLAVPLRAAKLNRYVTLHFAIAEYGVLVGGLGILLAIQHATPFTVGLVQCLFAASFLLLNAGAVWRLRR